MPTEPGSSAAGKSACPERDGLVESGGSNPDPSWRAQEMLRLEPLPETPRGTHRSILSRRPMERAHVRENPGVKGVEERCRGWRKEDGEQKDGEQEDGEEED
ncbi:hypothetical protein NDU88_006805 [Pleurodeles waltl]|uniref:Uncharacterized protein n=1 Tax=Pleurodeles waltl TaxID=8319 RepID=A0AAV7UN12_PLEWA|nr:hypothetical protein NDU88_006805 [Pleurodeles waltl]